MQVQFDSNRQFGVEIETAVSGPSIPQIARALNEAGIPTANEGYNHTTMSIWKVVPDGSTGPEVVSPPLKGQDGLDQIKAVCDVLNAIGCRVNRSTGIHVHHDFEDATVTKMKSVLFLYAKAQVLTNALLPTRVTVSNGNGRFTGYANQLSLSMIEAGAQRVNSMYSRSRYGDRTRFFASNVLSGEDHPRYHTVNSQAFLGHGTIEFRQHSGSLNAQKIQSWVVFTQNIMTVATSKNITSKALENKSHAAIWKVMATLGRDTHCPITKKARQNIFQRIFENAERGRLVSIGISTDLRGLNEFLGVARRYLKPEQLKALKRISKRISYQY